jgi:hypothetical protein
MGDVPFRQLSGDDSENSKADDVAALWQIIGAYCQSVGFCNVTDKILPRFGVVLVGRRARLTQIVLAANRPGSSSHLSGK